jgi:hypothetical protein
MGLRELKETAHQQFVRGKFAECAATYQRILRLAPRDPNMHVRHAEACRRSGEPQQAISSYRTAAGLLLELGCASRARGALKAALELDPRDSLLQLEIAQLESNPDTLISSVVSGELPLLPPLESGVDPVPPQAAPSVTRSPRSEDRLRTTALPPIHRALPSAQPMGPPVLLPPPGVRSEVAGLSAEAPVVPASSNGAKWGADLASAAATAQPLPQSRMTPPGYRPLPPLAKAPPPAPRQSTPSGPPPVLHPVDTAPVLPRMIAPIPAVPVVPPSASLPPRSATQGAQASAVPAVAPPPPPADERIRVVRELPLARRVSETVASGPSRGDVPRLEVLRLSPSTIAFRSSPKDGWAVIRSHTPLEMHIVEDLEKLPPMLQDIPAELTVESEAEGASTTVH